MDIVSAVDVLESLETGIYSTKECSYSKGYVRQAIFACKDCDRSGVCFGCAMTCHKDHTLYELYEKRHFKCDCGTDKMKACCQLMPKEGGLNTENVYNHNFENLYCWCNAPFDENGEHEMYQCLFCEDWFHDKCIGEMANPDTFDEFICSDCVSKFPILKRYHTIPQFQYRPSTHEPKELTVLEHETSKDCKAIHSEEMKGPFHLFVSEGWIEEMCQCKDCQLVYSHCGLSFIFEPMDEYEPPQVSVDDMLVNMLESMDRTVALESIYAFDHLKKGLKEYLKEFAKDGRVVEPQDILNFFEELRESKRVKRE